MKRSDLLLFTALGLLLLLACLALFTWAWRASAERDAGPFRDEIIVKMMRQKEEASAAIERGIAAADFARMESGITRLRELATAADWYVADSAYRQQSDAFRQALEQLHQSVRNRELDAAQGAYADLRAACAECHAVNQSSPPSASTSR